MCSVNCCLTGPYPALSLTVAEGDAPGVGQGCAATDLKANNLKPLDCTCVATLFASQDKEVWT
jgi:hypothetical protein